MDKTKLIELLKSDREDVETTLQGAFTKSSPTQTQYFTGCRDYIDHLLSYFNEENEHGSKETT